MKFNNECVLQDEGHKYLTTEGKRLKLPSATALVNIIYRFPVELIDPKRLRMGIERGNHFHKSMEILLTMGIDYHCCDSKTHAMYFRQGKVLWNLLAKNLEIDEVYSELPLYNNLYCGTIDVIAHSKKLDKWVIIDFKTTSWGIATTREKQDEILNKESLQLYLYSQLIKELNVEDFYIVNPNKNQCYKLSDPHLTLAKRNYQWLLDHYDEIIKKLNKKR